MVTIICFIAMLIVISTLIILGIVMSKHMSPNEDERSDADRNKNDF